MKVKAVAILSLMVLSLGVFEALALGVTPEISLTELSRTLQSGSVMFIQNAGQFDDRILFQVHSSDKTIWLTKDGIWITLPKQESTGAEEWRSIKREPYYPLFFRSPAHLPVRSVAIKLSFPGANPHPRVEPLGRLEISVNYFIGNDPAKWRTNVPVWTGVRYVDLYPGIDLELTGESGYVMQRVVARPGANLSAVRLRIVGAEEVELLPNKSGLRLTTGVGEFALPLLTVESREAGDPSVRRIGVQTFDVAYPMTSASLHPSTFTQGQSDLLYATFFGGSGEDFGYNIATDRNGNIYITGETSSSDFPVTSGAYDITYNGGEWDAFVVKINPIESRILYAAFIGGSKRDVGSGIAVDKDGNAYLTGVTGSHDFPTTPGVYDTSFNGDYGDAFVVKLNPQGSGLLYATYLGGSGLDVGSGIAVDESGYAYVTGGTDSTDFPTTSMAFDRIHNGGMCGLYPCSEAFVVKLDTLGKNLLYATFIGGLDIEGGSSIVVDIEGNAYITGMTSSYDFPISPNAYDRIFGGGICEAGGVYTYICSDAFVVKLNALGTGVFFSTFLGGSGNDFGEDIVVDASGNIYVTGATYSSDFPVTAGAYDASYNGESDAFLVKLNPAGNSPYFATFLGGSAWDWSTGITIDVWGNVYLTGDTSSPDFPITPNAFDTTYDRTDGDADVFVVKMNSSGTGLFYSTFLGGSFWDNDDDGEDIALDKNGNAYIVGATNSPDFPTTFDAVDKGWFYYEAFLAKLALGPFYIIPIYPTLDTISSSVMQGGIIYRYFRLIDTSGNPISDAIITFSAGSSAVTDAQGYFTATIQADSLGAPGSYTVSIQSVTIGGQTHSTNNQPAFPVEVKERRYVHSWSYGAVRRGSGGIGTGIIAYLKAETNGGLGLTLEESDPNRTDDDRVEMEEHYSLEVSADVGVGIRQNIGALVDRSDLDASVTTGARLRHFGDLEAQFNQPYADSDRKAQGIFLTLSVLDSVTGIPAQPLVVGILRVASARLPYLDYISAQSVGTAVEVTPLRAHIGAQVELMAKRSGSQSKSKTLGFTLLDVGHSHLVAMVLTDYGDEYSVGFEEELSLDLTMLSPDLPWIQQRLIGLLGNTVRRLHKEYFFDSVTGQLKRIELTLISEGNPNVFTDVTKKRVSVRMILEGPNLTPSLIERVGQAQVASDLSDLLRAVPQIPYSVEVEDGSSVSVVPELKIPGTEIGIGLGLEVESLRNLVRERGVYLNGKPYITEGYNADGYVARPGKNWSDLVSNALGGLWLLVQDAFNWVAQQITSGVGWVIGTISRTENGIIVGGAHIIAQQGTRLYAHALDLQGAAIQQTGPITVTAIGWVPKSVPEAGPLALRPAMAAASGEGFVVGGIYGFQPYTLTLSPAATLVITYTDEAATGMDENCIRMFRWNEEKNNWQPIPANCEPAQNQCTTPITQLGTFALGYDAVPPRIIILEPVDGSIIRNTLPLIYALVVDTGVGIDPETVQMRLDGEVTTATYITGTGELVYLPPMPLAAGRHTVEVRAQDVLGNQSSAFASFTIRPEYKVYLPLILRNR